MSRGKAHDLFHSPRPADPMPLCFHWGPRLGVGPLLAAGGNERQGRGLNASCPEGFGVL